MGYLYPFGDNKLKSVDTPRKNLHPEINESWGLQSVLCQAVEMSPKSDTTKCKTEECILTLLAWDGHHRNTFQLCHSLQGSQHFSLMSQVLEDFQAMACKPVLYPWVSGVTCVCFDKQNLTVSNLWNGDVVSTGW